MINNTDYMQTCVDTCSNSNYLWTMATNGNYANYATGSNYAILNEANYRSCRSPIVNQVYNGGQVCNLNKYAMCDAQLSRYALQMHNAKRNQARYSNGMCSGANGSSCNLSNDYASFDTPMTTTQLYASGPYNNFGWDAVNTAPRYNVSAVQNPVASYTSLCINGGTTCSKY